MPVSKNGLNRLTLNVLLPPEADYDLKEELRHIAYRLGYRHGYNKGSVSALLTAIAQGDVLCVPAEKNDSSKYFFRETDN